MNGRVYFFMKKSLAGPILNFFSEKADLSIEPPPTSAWELIENKPRYLFCQGKYGGPLEANTKTEHKPTINLFIGGQQVTGEGLNIALYKVFKIYYYSVYDAQMHEWPNL